jgi:hypothetical protein
MVLRLLRLLRLYVVLIRVLSRPGAGRKKSWYEALNSANQGR